MLWTKDEHLGHLLQALLQEKHFCLRFQEKLHLAQSI